MCAYFMAYASNTYLEEHNISNFHRGLVNTEIQKIQKNVMDTRSITQTQYRYLKTCYHGIKHVDMNDFVWDLCSSPLVRYIFQPVFVIIVLALLLSNGTGDMALWRATIVYLALSIMILLFLFLIAIGISGLVEIIVPKKYRLEKLFESLQRKSSNI